MAENAFCDEKATLGYAEGQTFIIEYVDAKKQSSTRRITVWGIKKGSDDIPVLTADCHERKAARSFRIDRIKTIFDFDGEIAGSVPSYLTENFGMHPKFAELANSHILNKTQVVIDAAQNFTNEKRAKPDHKLTAIKGYCRSMGVHLLWCFANIDEEFHPAEFQVIQSYCYEICNKNGVVPTDQEMEIVSQYIKRLRPTGITIDRAVENLSRQARTDVEFFLNACIQVAEADGVIHPDEVTAINTISNELVGRKLL